MGNFYGGRKGESFEIVASYSSISQMNNAFSQTNCSVNHGQYVIIDCPSDSTNHNKVYRRGLDGGEYVFQFQPSTQDLNLKLGAYDSTATNKGVVAATSTQQSGLMWSVKAANDNSITLGLDLPYVGFDFSVSTGEELGMVKDVRSTPLNQKWTLTIPKVDSIYLNNLRVVSPATLTTYNKADGTTITTELGHSYLVYDAITSTDILTYCLGEYNIIKDVSVSNNAIQIIDSNTTYYTQLKTIDSISYDDTTSQITITYNGEYADDVINISYVNDISLDDDSNLILKYSDGSEKNTDKQINYIKEVKVPETGTYMNHLLALYSGSDYKGEITYEGKDGWVDLGQVQQESSGVQHFVSEYISPAPLSATQLPVGGIWYVVEEVPR